MKATPQNIVKIFKASIQFLKENNWCQKAFAYTSKGNKVTIDNPDAKIFCASAAIEISLKRMGISTKEVTSGLDLTSDVFIKENEIDICVFNDRPGQTKEKVIMAFQKIVDKYERLTQ